MLDSPFTGSTKASELLDNTKKNLGGGVENENFAHEVCLNVDAPYCREDLLIENSQNEQNNELLENNYDEIANEVNDAKTETKSIDESQIDESNQALAQFYSKSENEQLNVLKTSDESELKQLFHHAHNFDMGSELFKHIELLDEKYQYLDKNQFDLIVKCLFDSYDEMS